MPKRRSYVDDYDSGDQKTSLYQVTNRIKTRKIKFIFQNINNCFIYNRGKLGLYNLNCRKS